MDEHDQFIEWAKNVLQRRVGECKVDQVVKDDDGLSISETTYAYKAAVLMRAHRLESIPVRSADERIVGSVTRTSLGDIVGIMDAAPYLGEEMMALIVPQVREPEPARR
jgi:CBS-domain-containing membrane protein